MTPTRYSESRALLPALLLSMALASASASASAATVTAEPVTSRAVTPVEANVAAPTGTETSADAHIRPVAEQNARPPRRAKRVRRIDIGAATGNLLAMQRESVGEYPRFIDGEQAHRSYQRYLKSFETTIPEHYDTGLDIKKQ